MQHFSVQHMLPVRNNVTEELLSCVKLDNVCGNLAFCQRAARIVCYSCATMKVLPCSSSELCWRGMSSVRTPHTHAVVLTPVLTW